jgi:hypothetical protein
VRAAGFRGLISGTFGGEIGQLTAQAILGMQEGREAEAVERFSAPRTCSRRSPPTPHRHGATRSISGSGGVMELGAGGSMRATTKKRSTR